MGEGDCDRNWDHGKTCSPRPHRGLESRMWTVVNCTYKVHAGAIDVTLYGQLTTEDFDLVGFMGWRRRGLIGVLPWDGSRLELVGWVYAIVVSSPINGTDGSTKGLYWLVESFFLFFSSRVLPGPGISYRVTCGPRTHEHRLNPRGDSVPYSYPFCFGWTRLWHSFHTYPPCYLRLLIDTKPS